MICTEREKWQICPVFHVADLEILETIADGNGLFYLRTYNNDGFVPISATSLPEVPGLSRMEHLVLASNLKTFHLLKGCIGIIIVLQMNKHGIILNRHILER